MNWASAISFSGSVELRASAAGLLRFAAFARSEVIARKMSAKPAVSSIQTVVTCSQENQQVFVLNGIRDHERHVHNLATKPTSMQDWSISRLSPSTEHYLPCLRLALNENGGAPLPLASHSDRK